MERRGLKIHWMNGNNPDEAERIICESGNNRNC
jgi:hypothetical protein